MCAEMHMGEVHPKKNRLVVFHLLLEEFHRPRGDVIVDGFHPFLGQRARVLDLLFSASQREAMNYAARAEVFTKVGKFRIIGLGIIRKLGLFLGVQMIEVAVEFVEAMSRRQEFVFVAQMVLAELAGCVALRFEKLGNRRVFLL